MIFCCEKTSLEGRKIELLARGSMEFSRSTILRVVLLEKRYEMVCSLLFIEKERELETPLVTRFPILSH